MPEDPSSALVVPEHFRVNLALSQPGPVLETCVVLTPF